MALREARSGELRVDPAANAASATIELSYRDVCVDFGALRVMGPTSLRIRKGEFVAVVGPSGCGKSTLLNLAAGLLKPTEGTVSFRGAPVDGPNRDVGYITQKNHCLPWRTVRENVRFPLELRRFPKSTINERATQAIRQVGLTGFDNAYPRQLSGGMLQRVMIARTLAYQPSTYLMDEPFGSLDAQLRLKMHADLLSLWESTGATFIFVTHDLHEAITLADRVIVFSHRPGVPKLTLDIDLPRPRDVVAVQALPR